MPNVNNKVNQDEKLFGALSYLWVISIIILIVKKDSEFVKFHARQGLVIFLVSVVLGWIPILGWPILDVILIIAIIAGLMKALNGEMWEVPVIGSLAKKIDL